MYSRCGAVRQQKNFLEKSVDPAPFQLETKNKWVSGDNFEERKQA